MVLTPKMCTHCHVKFMPYIYILKAKKSNILLKRNPAQINLFPAKHVLVLQFSLKTSPEKITSYPQKVHFHNFFPHKKAGKFPAQARHPVKPFYRQETLWY